MSYSFLSFPHFVAIDAYESAIQKMADYLKKQPGIKSIYRFGSISAPGISDIDLLAVFNDGTSCTVNPLLILEPAEKYLFTHAPFGITESHLKKLTNYNYHVNMSLVWGEEVKLENNTLDAEDTEKLKIQIVLEYLLRAYMAAYRNRKFKKIKIRSLLLVAHALRFDLQLLNITSGKFFDLVSQIGQWRKDWFLHPPEKTEISDWYVAHFFEIELLLKTLFKKHELYLPANGKMKMSKDIRLQPSKKFHATHIGVSVAGKLIKNYRVANKLFSHTNKFTFYMPIEFATAKDIHYARFEFLQTVSEYNKKNLSHFKPMTTVLNYL